MLEKIGLPEKPSMKGGNWVVDASHCQGCSSQFTFINRKHHCRRCGGLFCNSCTSQRMVLRGQGDSPVRICDPCKKIEEAARFELRYGHRNRTSKGSTKQASKLEEELLNNILGKNVKNLLSSGMEPDDNSNLDLKSFTSGGSSSTVKEEAVDSGWERGITGSMSAEIKSSAPDDFGSASPEKLRQQAVEEKKKYKILKAEGRSDEALRAFKHGKELERQAAALELALRKNRRASLKTSSLSTATVSQKIEGYEESMGTHKKPSRKGKMAKGDLEAELRELGWCDADLHEAEGKSAKLTLEGELSNLLGEATQKSFQGKKSIGVDKSKVIAMKKKALLLKREGKLAEAKEELKNAKILEKELEEQELLGQAEDSDDELSALIRSMDEDQQDELPDNAFRFDQSIGFTEDFPMDSNLEVTEDDMNDPELASALKSFGWSEEDDEGRTMKQFAPIDQESLRARILNLKKEAVSQKRAGNISEAMDLLKKAKLLEKDLENLQSDSGDFPPKFELNNSPEPQSDNGKTAPEIRKSPPKSKLMIQKELLALKKRALVLRREGHIDEAEEELKKGKALEQQLEEIESAPRKHSPVVARKNTESVHFHDNDPQTLDHVDEGVEADVTEQDMHDPSLLSALKSLGWNDDHSEPVNVSSEISMQRNGRESGPLFPKKSKNKAEIQRELLAVKRKALSLRRQGNTAEAEEELEKAKALEKQIAELESASSMIPLTGKKETTPLHDIIPEILDLTEREHEAEVTEEDMLDPALLSGLKNLGWNTNEDNDNEPMNNPSKGYNQIKQQILDNSVPQKAVKNKAEIQKELLALKRNALALRRQGKSEEANKELEKARVLEEQMVAMEDSSKSNIKEVESNDFGTLVPQRVSDNLQASLYTQSSVSGSSSVPAELNDPVFLVTDTAKVNSSNRPLESSVSVTRTIKSRPSAKEISVSSAAQQSGLLSNFINSDDGDTTLLSSVDGSSREDINGNIFSLAIAPTQAVGFQEKTGFDSYKLLDSQASFQMEGTDATVSNISVSSEQRSLHETDSLRTEIIARKRKAVALKREGKLAEAREELRQAKLMERTLEDGQHTEAASGSSSSTILHNSSVMQHGSTSQNQKPSSIESVSHSTSSTVIMQDNKISQPQKPLSSRDRFRIQQESLSHKRNALKLRREGKTNEADAELELAKSLERQLEDPDQSSSTNTNSSKSEGVDVEDMLDPQLMSALKAIGLVDVPTVAQPPKKVDANIDKNEKAQIEEQIKAERLRALNFKKAGKQTEALEALRAAKRLEKKLTLMG